MGAKLVTVFGQNESRGLPSHLATILLLDPDTGALVGLLDGRYITEARTAAVSAVSARHLARTNAATLAIIGSGVQARSHLEALAEVRALGEARVWSPRQASASVSSGDGVAPARQAARGRARGGCRPRRRHHRAGHLVSHTCHRERLGLARRARHLCGRMPAGPARNGSRPGDAGAPLRGLARRRAGGVGRRGDGHARRPVHRDARRGRAGAGGAGPRAGADQRGGRDGLQVAGHGRRGRRGRRPGPAQGHREQQRVELTL